MASGETKYNPSTEKRSKWWTRCAGNLLWAAIQTLCATLRVRTCRENPSDTLGDETPCIVALWHNRTLIPCYIYRKLRIKRPMCVLTSASKDGALLETVANRYGISAIRGSSGRRGATAFIEMRKYLRNGGNLCITPDGPKGPCYRSHQGIIKLASMTGVPISPVCIDYSSYWRINRTWDRFAIPVPFSKVVMYWKSPLHVPPDLTPEQIDEYCRRLDLLLSAGAPDFAPLTTTPSCNVSKEKQSQKQSSPH